jgi:PTH1 family peptidyl-tRNA hydrolase
MAREWSIRLTERRAKAVLGRGHRAGQEVVLAKPRTFMNNSGEGVAYLLTRFAANPSELVVIYDDMELPLGRLRIRPNGSDGGHNGVRSIIDTLQTQAFPRIRVGIGPPAPQEDPVSHVLGLFDEDEAPAISEAIKTVLAAADCLLEQDIDSAMNRFNR